MFNKLKQNWMAFKDIFKDENDVNEKSVVGFASFAIMVLFAIADLLTGYVGKDLVINEFIKSLSLKHNLIAIIGLYLILYNGLHQCIRC